MKTVLGRIISIYIIIATILVGVLGATLIISYQSGLIRTRSREMNIRGEDLCYAIEGTNSPSSDLAIDMGTRLASDFDAVINVSGVSGSVICKYSRSGIERFYSNFAYINGEIVDEIKTNKNPIIKQNGDSVSVYLPVINGKTNSVIYILEIKSDLSYLLSAVNSVYVWLWVPVAIAILIGFILVSMLRYKLIYPLQQMNQIAKEIGHGEFSHRVQVNSMDEIGQLSSAFNKMTDELSKLEELRTGFVANVTHELRSPLTSITGFVEGMIDKTIDPEEYEVYLKIIRKECNRLNKLISEMLTLSQIEYKKFPLKKNTFDINEKVRQCIIRSEPKIVKKNIDIDINFAKDKVLVNADPDRIDQVLENLLDNAIKFAPNNSVIKLSVIIENKLAKISITNFGDIITEEELPMIFKRFYTRDKARTSGKSGTGLGLSIVKKIIEQHNQSIDVVSNAKSGTCFSFTLDLSKQSKESIDE